MKTILALILIVFITSSAHAKKFSPEDKPVVTAMMLIDLLVTCQGTVSFLNDIFIIGKVVDNIVEETSSPELTNLIKKLNTDYGEVENNLANLRRVLTTGAGIPPEFIVAKEFDVLNLRIKSLFDSYNSAPMSLKIPFIAKEMEYARTCVDSSNIVINMFFDFDKEEEETTD